MWHLPAGRDLGQGENFHIFMTYISIFVWLVYNIVFVCLKMLSFNKYYENICFQIRTATNQVQLKTFL